MKTDLAIALLSAVVALSSAAIAIWGRWKLARIEAELAEFRVLEERRFEAEKTIAKYREPLARAAYDLQSRLYNILQQNLLGVYYDHGDDREQRYVVDNTTFVVAQYFAWTEIVRRDIQYIDLGDDEHTRRLARLQDTIYSLFQTDRFPKTLRVFAGEQRAIGEWMIVEGTKGLECIGYAAFLKSLDEDTHPLLDAIRSDVRHLSSALQSARPRLAEVQHALIDLLAFLDPDAVRFPKARRSKVATS